MKARYQFRFYPTDQQRQLLAQLFGCVRVVWNDALALCKKSVSVAGDATRTTKLPSNNDLHSFSNYPSKEN
ncbi:helix-turn-helix domain-containing protein [Nostoc sp.]|uniref:helix-turn-helix domain-containing protein n=1 Tax=Nostoc sp. TaxID=1180 RepID=UPI002FFA65D8